MTRWTNALLLASCLIGVGAMVYAGRPVSYHRFIRTAMVLWAALPYLVAYFVLNSASSIGVIGAGGILSLSIGPLLILNAPSLFGIDTRYDPIFMATPFLQIACFLPFGVLVRRKNRMSEVDPDLRTKKASG